MYCRVSTGVPRDSPPPPSFASTTAAASWRRWTVSDGGNAGGMSMLSRGRDYHLAPGSRLTLGCEFYMEAFNAFHNPVIWLKSQSTPANGGSQRIKINVMGIIQSPFSDDDDRFDVSLIKQPPRYELLLTVKGINVVCIMPSVRLIDISSLQLRAVVLFVLMNNATGLLLARTASRCRWFIFYRCCCFLILSFFFLSFMC